MPIVLSVLAGFFLGVAFAWMSRAELGRIDAPIVASRPFNVVVGFATFVYAPVLAFAFAGAWRAIRSRTRDGILLGQPVDLGSFGGLRIAISARDLLDGRAPGGLDIVRDALADVTASSGSWRRVSASGRC